MIYRRKLLGYERDFFETHPMRQSRSNRILHEEARTSDVTQSKLNIIAKDVESNDEDTGDETMEKTIL